MACYLILEMSRSLSIILYLRPFSITIYGKSYMYCLYYFRLFWFVNCTDLVYRLCITIGTVKIHKNCLYGSVFSTDINKKIVFNFLLIFKLFLLVSKLYESSQ